jgi:glycosyltransferase involved in cell wall biosynthesis
MTRLKILWLNHFVPYPPKGGCFQRNYNLITRMAAKHDVHLVAMRHKAATHPDAETVAARDVLQRHCASVHIVDIAEATEPLQLATRGIASMLTAAPLTVTIFRSREMTDLVKRLTREHTFDVTHFDTISLAQYLPLAPPGPTTMTHHGAESFMIRRRIARERSPIRKAFFLAEWLTLRRYEARECPKFDSNLVMSTLDGDILREIAPKAQFTVVPNGVDVGFFQPGPAAAAAPGPAAERALIFAGRLDQYSNRDAILHFVQAVWPLVRAAHPDLVMHIIGNNAPAELKDAAAADSRLRVHGFVPDVRPYFEQSTIAVCPIRDGGGTRIKILDALALGMPIVSTSIGCEGIDVVDGRDVLFADTPDAFAAQIGRILTDDTLRRSLAQAARRLAEDVYSWDGIADRLSAQYVDLARAHAARRRTA